jgi:histidinol-phosphate/aromatic aminotransferase/cobyric acid decarboxylase-like protein
MSQVWPRIWSDLSIINFGVADNRLMGDLLLPKLQNRPGINEVTITYGGLHPNSTGFLPELCNFYRDYLGIPDATPRRLILGSGIANIVEKLGFLFLNPGDVVLLPIPTYHGFLQFLERFQPQFVFIDPKNLPDHAPANAKLLMITNPGNPFGEYVSPELIEWGLRIPNCQIIIDEVYAMCDKRPDVPFVSLFANTSWDPNRVHHCYGISKDWGMAGLKLGIFFSRSKKLMKAFHFALGTYAVTGDMLKTMEGIFCDTEFVGSYVATLKKRLEEAERTAAGILRESGLTVLTHTSSMFLNIDLTQFVHNEEEEADLTIKFLDAKVFVLPHGIAMHGRYGVFRVVYAVPNDQLVEGCKRIIATVQKNFQSPS